MRSMMPLVLAVLVLSAAPAYAHPFTDSTVPEQFSSAPVGTSEVSVIYSEAIELEFSELRVYDGSGERIDNADTRYLGGEKALIVTVPPLEDGVYTVSSKVLSKVDGHLVSYTFVFGVGDAKVAGDAGEIETELIFYPEAGASTIELAGQTIVLGSVFAAVAVWAVLEKRYITSGREKIARAFHSKFMAVVGAGLLLVVIGNIAALAIQTLRLDASPLDVLGTASGTMWIVRMSITAALIAAWFATERAGRLSIASKGVMLGLSLLLIGTTTMMGHGAASEEPLAIALDYLHNLVASIWIGGLVFFAFVLIPALGILGNGRAEALTLAAIPRFSTIFVLCIGAVIITGPTLLWILESDVDLITESTYGKLIFAKIAIASAMVAVGGYHQFGVQRGAQRNPQFELRRRMRRALGAEIVMGMVLLGAVALLANGTLPEGEIQRAEALESTALFSTVEFAETLRFEIEIAPLVPGTNTMRVTVSDQDGAPEDLDSLKVKISNPQRGISPIEVPFQETGRGDGGVSFEGEPTFGFSGRWQIEAEAQRTDGANEGILLEPQIRPRLADMNTRITEYNLSEFGAPFHIIYDDDKIWMSDTSGPVIWEFDIDSEEFSRHEYDGGAPILLAMDGSRDIWFVDIQKESIGYVLRDSKDTTLLPLPELEPTDQKSIPTSITFDGDGSAWITILNKNTILSYDTESGEFERFSPPTPDSGPFIATYGPDGKIWFTQQLAGQIGYLDPQTGVIREVVPDEPLDIPETITFDAQGIAWITEHAEGGAITRLDPDSGKFERIGVPDARALPNSAVLDRFGNIWFVQHTVDRLGAYDPYRAEFFEVPIPTEESWVQFAVSDDDGNIWFAEQKPARLGMLQITEVPNTVAPDISAEAPARYSEIAGPLISAGIVAVSLFFVKSVRDGREIDAAIKRRSSRDGDENRD